MMQAPADISPISTEERDTWDWILIAAGAAALILGLAISFGLTLLSLIAEEPVALGVEAASILGLGFLGIPAIYWGAKGPMHRAVRRPGPVWILALLIFPLALILGMLAFEMHVLTRILGPFAHILAAGGPVLFVASVSLTRGPLFSARRRWAHFLAGSWITPPLSLMMEFLALIPFGLLLIAALLFSPDSQSLIQELMSLDISAEDEMIDLATRLLAQPLVILLGIGLLSGAVPIIEELLKSLTIWPLLSRSMTGGQAFLGGALGGAGYALFESLFLPQAGDEWVITMVARAGTPLIHAFNTGLVCWGLAEGVRRKRWGFFGGTYILAVGLHGMWNLAAIGIGLSGLGVESAPNYLNPATMISVGYLGLFGLFALTGGSLFGLIWLPGRLDSVDRLRPLRT